MKQIFRKLANKSVLFWILLCLTSILLFIVEVCNWNRVFHLNQTMFWINTVTPFCTDLDANLINLFISQISSTFLITAFLSFLSDKDDPIYWTTAMEFKLVKPAGTSLRNIMEYCLGTLIISLIAVFTRTKLMFLFAFIANLVGLSIITFRMIFAFFSRGAMKKQLQKEFIEASPEQRTQMLLDMETYIVNAAHNHNVGYLRECIEFFQEFEKNGLITFDETYIEKMVWIFQIIPEQLSEIRLSILEILCAYLDINDLVQSTWPNREVARRNHLMRRIETEVNNKHSTTKQQDFHKEQTAFAVLSGKRSYIQNGIITLLRNQIEHGILTDLDSLLWRDAVIAFFQLDLEERLATAIARDGRPYLGTFSHTSLDLSAHIRPFVFLLEYAYYKHRILDSYITTFRILHNLIDLGANYISTFGEDVNANVYAQLNESERHKIPARLRDAIHCYSWDDALTIFKCLCSQDALIQTPNDALGILFEVFDRSKGLTKEQKEELLTILKNASHIEEYLKQTSIEQLRQKHNLLD